MTRLNLGCGRAQLPTTRGNPRTEHLEHSLPETAYTERWVNVDRAPVDGVDEVVDLFAYPWARSSNGSPWNESSVDEIWSSHLIEHIPHTPRWTPAIGMYPAMKQVGALDGWYAFFMEAWRVLKPGGLIHVVTPFAWSTAGVSDPSHTRLLLTSSFSYFMPNEDAPFDYQIPYQLEAVDDPVVYLTEKGEETVASVNTTMARQQGKPTTERIITNDDVYRIMLGAIDMADTIYGCFRALKDS